jgi:hypothetical protein
MYIDVRGGDRFAASQGSCGGFLEKLSVATGERTSRCVLPGATTRAEPACVRHIRVDGS